MYAAKPSSYFIRKVIEFNADINATDIFVIGAATKGLQVPGMRTGWVIASREHVEIFRNFSSIAIQLGGIGGLAPSRRHDLSRVGLRAMVAGSLAAFMTATVAGMLL